MIFSPQIRLQFIVLLWGFTGVLGKLITIDAIPLVWFRVLVASIVLFIILKIRKISLKINLNDLLMLLGIGVVIGLHWMAFFGAIKVSNVAVALSTLSTGALFSAFLEPIFFKRKINVSEIILAIVVSCCILLIYNAKPEYWLGIVLGIICSFLSALFSVLNGKIHTKFPSQKIMFYEMIGGLMVVCMFLPFVGGMESIINVSWKDLGLLLLLGSLFTAYPMIESVSLMKFISPFTLLLNVNLEPVYGIILAWLIFGESEEMTPLFYVATSIMVLAIVVNMVLKKKSKAA
ncbi:DMT family transporter [Moheibacter sediminis]|uniref:Threonine/homoserine efflux transporter RhtA n=1 Tax=Moheibacter sediminis TaxID=1434700 RepID=A0A1W2AJY4_9FLAO|nr:EamA family transporter [Moheibacter sediminis]SMC60976.1 Threonine/homoserine efflux transporter RhtA [Moheibacter sediminis]